MSLTLTPRLTALPPAHAQHIFRTCLNAMARPGTIGSWEPEWTAGITAAEAPVAIAPVLALADLMAPVAAAPEAAAVPPASTSAQPTASTESTVNTEYWTAEIARLTGALHLTLDRARLVLSLGEPDAAALAALNRGTPATPHRAALLVQRVADLRAPQQDRRVAGERGAGDLTSVLRLSGPGIADSTVLEVTGPGEEFYAVRSRLVAGFPQGIDLLFVTDQGSVAGLPRTTAIRREETR